MFSFYTWENLDHCKEEVKLSALGTVYTPAPAEPTVAWALRNIKTGKLVYFRGKQPSLKKTIRTVSLLLKQTP